MMTSVLTSIITMAVGRPMPPDGICAATSPPPTRTPEGSRHFRRGVYGFSGISTAGRGRNPGIPRVFRHHPPPRVPDDREPRSAVAVVSTDPAPTEGMMAVLRKATGQVARSLR